MFGKDLAIVWNMVQQGTLLHACPKTLDLPATISSAIEFFFLLLFAEPCLENERIITKQPKYWESPLKICKDD